MYNSCNYENYLSRSPSLFIFQMKLLILYVYVALFQHNRTPSAFVPDDVKRRGKCGILVASTLSLPVLSFSQH